MGKLSKYCPFDEIPSCTGDKNPSITPVRDCTMPNRLAIFNRPLANVKGRNAVRQSKSSMLNVKLQNIRSLFNKLDVVKSYLLINNVDICFFTETWLNSNIRNSMINIPGYEILRSDRHNKRGGGVAVYYKDSLNVQLVNPRIKFLTFSNFEYIALELNTSSSSKILFLCFYIPPDSAKCIQTVTNMVKIVSSYISHTQPFVLLGDLNFPSANWTTFTSNESPTQHFLDYCLNNSLSQEILSQTHSGGNVLDIALCNISAKSLLTKTSVDCSISIDCDHYLVSLYFNSLLSKKSKVSKIRYNFKKGNYDVINQELLSYDWSFLNSDLPFQDRYDNFIKILNDTIEKHIPCSTNSDSKNTFLPKYIRNLRKSKLRTYRLFKSGKCSKQTYKDRAKKYEYEVKLWHEKQEKSFCENPDIKKLYSYANRKLNNNFSIPNLNDDLGNSIATDKEKASLLNNTFYQNFTTDNGNTLSPFPKNYFSMDEIYISKQDIVEAIESTKDKLTDTPESIPPYFIKRCLISLLTPLHLIYNYSLKHNFIPFQWKQSSIIPIYKKGDRALPSNYRPIALTSSFCRILEAIILKYMLSHLLKNNLLLSNQFGFLPSRSSCSQLLWCLQDWYTAYFEKNPQYVVYTDITKAFDSVSHSKLLTVLTSYGFNPEFLSWIQNFLSDRSQSVKLNNTYSSFLPILSGVPQGSVLGPLLFVIFINDICLHLNSKHNIKIALFADDAKFISTDTEELQHCLNTFCDTIQNYQLKLAPMKSFVLRIGKRATLNTDDTNFFMESSPLLYQDYAKDLGIFFQSDLKWERHVNFISRQASITSYQILKSFRSKNIWTLLSLYKCYIRPRLEYNTEIWSPYLKKNINKIEQIQKRYTKQIFQRCNILSKSYSDRLYKLNIMSLENRRIKFDLILLFKIMNNLSDLKFEDYFYYESHSYSLRNNITKVRSKSKFTGNLWHGSFFNRAPNYWNKLHFNISSTKSLDVFKLRLNVTIIDDLK